MKVSLEWLKDFVAIQMPLAPLCDRLTMGGLEVIGTEKKGSDTILEIEVTPNRPDLLSHVGIAREIAVLTGARLRFPKTQHAVRSTPAYAFASARQSRLWRTRHVKKLPLRISIQDKKGCLRYIGRLSDGVQVGATPPWIRERLERLGLRSVNNAVDITNYVLLETGQPLHAFDYDKIEGGAVIIRSARQGETLLTLEGRKCTFEKGELVIADASKPIALAGVVGGKATEITRETTRVLLESAYFDPVRVRRASKRLGSSTESSYRFERGVSLEGVQTGSERAQSLFERYTKAFLVAPAIDQGKKSFPKRTVSVSFQELDGILGLCPKVSHVRSILSSLGCRVGTSKKALRIIPPPFRQDLKDTVDVAEEVGRIFGYDRIPTTAPLRERVPVEKETVPADAARITGNRIRELLVSQGLFEVVTYSLLSKALLAREVFDLEASAIPIRNPISLEQELLRPSLIPRLIEVAAYNHHRKVGGVPIFEIGPVYEKQGNAYRERKKIGILLSGIKPGNWKEKPSPYDYFDLRGKCDALVKSLNPSLMITYQAVVDRKVPAMELWAGGKPLGILKGLASPDTFGIREKLFVAELEFSELLSLASSAKFTPLPKFPSVRRDISLIADRRIPSEALVRLIQTEGGEWVEEITLFDTYADSRIVPEGSQGLAYRIGFRHPDRTLTDEEVNGKYQAILEALKRLGVRIRAV